MSTPLSLNNLADDGALEAEELDTQEGELERPYDPTLIRVEPKMFSLRNILDMIDEGEVDLAPDFQRLKVWSPRQKSRLVESILLRIPLPAFYFASDNEGRLQVVDGVQRLSTIYDFVRSSEGFPLVQLEYLTAEVGGKKFEQIKNTLWAKRIHGTQIVANVIDPQTPTPVKFDIFKRINTGGTPLNSQEIRHCMSKGPSRRLLMELTSTDEFVMATGGSITNHVRMADREMALRVVAFTMYGIDGYLRTDGLDQFLNEATSTIDSIFTPKEFHAYSYHFTKAMRLANEIFGEYAFRKWPLDEQRRFPINRAIFEAMGAILLKADPSSLKPYESIRDNYRRLCTNDYEFIAYVTQSTSSASSVAGRFAKLEKVLLK